MTTNYTKVVKFPHRLNPRKRAITPDTTFFSKSANALRGNASYPIDALMNANMTTTHYCYLTLTSGPRSGANYMLDPAHVSRLGRGIDCDVVLLDPLCSRVHAEVFYEEDQWWVRDAKSRNGTYVDGNQIQVDRLPLEPGTQIRTGSSEFTFHSSDQPPTVSFTRETQVTEDIIRQAPVDVEDSGRIALASLRANDNAADLERLFQLSLRLLDCDEPLEVLQLTLQQIHDRTQAAVVGFLWITEENELKPQLRIPVQSAGEVGLSESLTQMVIEHRRAVWVNQTSSADASAADSLRPYADAVCVPVVRNGETIGAIHLYLGQGKFRDIDFEFAISTSQVLSAALARTRRQASLAADHQRLVDSSAACDDMIGDSTAMEKLKAKITKLARANGSVLIIGESGSGKELVSAAIHKASLRADRPMLAVNCAAIPETLVESQLFGHVKGSFTGATEDRMGWFLQADTGTLFLDEIGELPLEAQGKLLRILEGHPFLPVGGSEEISVDVRVIAATNRDLRELVREKQFREDLYYRLSVFDLKIPPLREREGDVMQLIEHFLEHFRRRHGRPQLELSEKAKANLLEYVWPGNVRQLRNVIDSAVVMANGNTIEPEDLGLHDAGTDHLDTLLIEEWEKKLIRMALRKTANNVPEAAKLLGIGRATLYRKLDEYKIERR